MAVCAIDDSEKTGTMNAAPSLPHTPQTTAGQGGAVYYIGGGGGNTTIIQNYTLSGTVGDFTSTGMANFYNAGFSGTVSFISLPSIPLTYGALLFGNNLDIATELLGGSTGQVLSMANGVPTWVSV